MTDHHAWHERHVSQAEIDEGADQVIELLKRRGLHQGGAQGPRGEICLLTALAVGCRNNYVAGVLQRRIGRLISGGHYVASLATWNDQKGRTLGEVIKVINDARESIV